VGGGALKGGVPGEGSHGRFDDVPEVGVGGPQCLLEVGERLAAFGVEPAVQHLPGVRVDAGLSRDEEQVARRITGEYGPRAGGRSRPVTMSCAMRDSPCPVWSLDRRLWMTHTRRPTRRLREGQGLSAGRVLDW
jgi:hypothetical protein